MVNSFTFECLYRDLVSFDLLLLPTVQRIQCNFKNYLVRGYLCEAKNDREENKVFSKSLVSSVLPTRDFSVGYLSGHSSSSPPSNVRPPRHGTSLHHLSCGSPLCRDVKCRRHIPGSNIR